MLCDRTPYDRRQEALSLREFLKKRGNTFSWSIEELGKRGCGVGVVGRLRESAAINICESQACPT